MSVPPVLEAVGDRIRVIYGSPIYVYSSYWSNWSRRVMSEVSPSGVVKYLDYSLEPINSHIAGVKKWEEDVLPIRLRMHYTSADSGDKKCRGRDLPPALISRMYAMIGDKEASRLLYTDVYPIIDWEKWEVEERRHSAGGGIPLEKVRKDPACPICKTSTFVKCGELSYQCSRLGCDSSFIPSEAA